MKTKLILPVLATALTFSAMAAVPHLIHHQGILQNDEGDPVNGPADFKFAFVNQDGSVTYWSNDGTSFAGSEPAAAVALPVSDGLFNVQLGDTDLGMQALPPTVFAADDVALRIWVNGELLTPDRRVTSVGYAMQAATVAFGAINPNSIPDNTIQSKHIANHSISSDDLQPTITLETLNLEKGGNQLTELTTANNSPILNFWDALGNHTTHLGDLMGGGRLKLFQINGKPGITADGDAATYGNASSAGGELTVHDPDGKVGVMLDGDSNGGARIEMRRAGGLTPAIDALAAADNGGAKVVVRGSQGADGVEILGQGSSGGSDPSNPGGGPLNGSGTIRLYQPGGLGAVLYGSVNQGGGAISLRNTKGDSRFRLYGGPGSATMQMAQDSGVVSIEANAVHGTFGGSRFVLRQDVLGKPPVNTVQLDGGTNEFGEGGGRIRLRNDNNEVTVEIDAADADGHGIVRTQVLEITGGSDLAEHFDINAGGLEPEPGMLVSIDPHNPGELVLSTKAYDRTAAGVISGAGGVNPGLMMGQKGSIADGEHPVALTGRVYCHVDASFGAIGPGDLITTSPVPGHGMKVSDHERAQGAIIGKAMTSLDEGRGLVLVLVSLQ